MPMPRVWAKVKAVWANPWVRRPVCALGFILLGLTLLEFPRFAYNTNHDLSSQASFEYYAAHHFQFGQQVYQNVGPYGYVHYGSIYAGYLHIQKVLLAAVYRVGLLLLVVWLGHRLPHIGLRLGWWAAFFILQPLSFHPQITLDTQSPDDAVLGLDWSQVYSYLTVYLAALYLLQERKDWRFRAASVGLLCFLAFVALTKHTCLVLAVCAVGAVSLQKLVRRDALPALLNPAVFVGSVVIHWVLAGQGVAHLPGFIRGVFAFSSGYNEAMMRSEPAYITLIGFLIVVLLLARSLYNAFALRQGLGRTLFEAALLYVAWKHGFVRADFFHVSLFFFAAAFLAVPFCFALLPFEGGGKVGVAQTPRWLGFANWSCLAVMGLVLLTLLRFCQMRSCDFRPGSTLKHLGSNLAWVMFPGRQTAELRRGLQKVEADYALPLIKAAVGNARVDYFGYSPGVVLLNHLNYSSRPMPIAFAASNRLLERANEAFYRSSNTAPGFVICKLHSGLDERAPVQDDALALRALLDNYHPVGQEHEYLLLGRNEGALQESIEKKPLLELNTRFGTQINLREWSNGLVWMEADIEHSLLGKMLSFLYKPPACYLGYHCVGESRDSANRFVTAMGGSGCLLTPFIVSNADLMKLYQPGNGLDGLLRIESFGFVCEPGDRKFFRDEIHIRLYAVGRPSERLANP